MKFDELLRYYSVKKKTYFYCVIHLLEGYNRYEEPLIYQNLLQLTPTPNDYNIIKQTIWLQQNKLFWLHFYSNIAIHLGFY